jgi:tRNA G37 N-methylase Trm5
VTRVYFSASAPNQREYVTVVEAPEAVVAAFAGGGWVPLTQDLGRGKTVRLWVNPDAVRYVAASEP